MEHLLTTAKEAARAAGARLLELLGKATVRHKEVAHNLVTQADLEAEQLITERIARRYPEHTFLLEEGKSTGVPNDPHLWVIDPLDATNNYAHGIPHFCVSIAYAERGAVQAGVVFDPPRDELFHAIRGGGAFLNEVPIRVSPAVRFEECIIGTGFYYDRGAMMRRTLDSIHALFTRNIRGIRRMGSAAIDLSWVACGRFDAFFEYKLEPWDYAAGQLLIEEAGGVCTDRVGRPLEIGSGNVIAGNSRVHPLVLEVVKWPGETAA